jgi:hypothetical protein
MRQSHAAFPRANVTCRCCSAVGAVAKCDFGLCDWCWDRFRRWLHDAKATETKCNEWLAREVFMAARRLSQFGVLGRCEAMAGGDSVLIDQGQLEHGRNQCKSFASQVRDGHCVCAKHAEKRTRLVMWADQPRERPYVQFTKLLVDIGARDPRFVQCLDEAKAAISKK